MQTIMLNAIKDHNLNLQKNKQKQNKTTTKMSVPFNTELDVLPADDYYIYIFFSGFINVTEMVSPNA